MLKLGAETTITMNTATEMLQKCKCFQQQYVLSGLGKHNTIYKKKCVQNFHHCLQIK